VHASPGTAGGYRLGAGGALPPLLLDDEEAVAVAGGHAALSWEAPGVMLGDTMLDATRPAGRLSYAQSPMQLTGLRRRRPPEETTMPEHTMPGWTGWLALRRERLCAWRQELGEHHGPSALRVGLLGTVAARGYGPAVGGNA